MRVKGKRGIHNLIFVVLLSAVVLTPSMSAPPISQSSEVSDAIEIMSDRDVILTLGEGMSELRHMLEIFALVGANVKYKTPKKRLKDNIDRYESRIGELKKRYKSGEIARGLDRAMKVWSSIKDDLMIAFKKGVSKDEMRMRAMNIHSKVRSIIKEIEHVKDMVIQSSYLSNIKELNAAIEINSSLRRISSHYVMGLWKLDDPTIHKHWKEGIEVYRKSLEILQNSKFAEDEKFQSLLDILKQEYNEDLFMILERMGRNDKFAPSLLQIHTDKASKATMKIIEMILDRDL